jgi:hypothetical protein
MRTLFFFDLPAALDWTSGVGGGLFGAARNWSIKFVSVYNLNLNPITHSDFACKPVNVLFSVAV